MKRNLAILCTPVAVLAVNLSAEAHDGHGHTADAGHSPLHYVTEPIHLFPLAMVAVLALAAIYGLVRMNRARTAAGKASFNPQPQARQSRSRRHA